MSDELTTSNNNCWRWRSAWWWQMTCKLWCRKNSWLRIYLRYAMHHIHTIFSSLLVLLCMPKLNDELNRRTPIFGSLLLKFIDATIIIRVLYFWFLFHLNKCEYFFLWKKKNEQTNKKFRHGLDQYEFCTSIWDDITQI